MAFSPNGEDTILICPSAVTRRTAKWPRSSATNRPAKRRCRWRRSRRRTRPPSRRWPICSEIPLAKTAKAVFYKGGSGRFVFAVIRGDLDVNETKLRKATGETGLTPATVEEIRAIGAEAGLRLAGGSARCADRHRRERARHAESGGGREQGRLAPAQYQSRARLRAGRGRRHRVGRGRIPLPEMRRCADRGTRDRSRKYLQAGHALFQGARRRRIWMRRGSAIRSSWVRMASVPGASRRRWSSSSMTIKGSSGR